MVQDYEKYKSYRNITFLAVCSSPTATLKSMEKQVEQFRLHPFANMLDAAGATANTYKVPQNTPFWLIVVDGEGNIAFNASRGWYMATGPNTRKYIHHSQTEKSLAKYPGILGRKDVPPGMELAAHYYDLQQFRLLEAELKKAEGKKAGSADAKEFAAYIRSKAAETCKARAGEITEMAGTHPVQAYREATAFVAAYPGTPEKTAIMNVGKDLLKQPDVKKELAAEDAYRRILVPQMKKVSQSAEGSPQSVVLQSLLEGYLKTYSDTEYAQAVTNAVEAYKMAAGRSR